MKTLSLNIIGLGGLFSLLVSSAFAISSTPVGYMTVTVNPTADQKFGLPMEQAAALSGAVSSVTAGAIDAGAAVGDLTTNAHYVKLTSGSLVGQIFEITQSTGNTLTVAEDLEASGVSATDTFVAIPYWTLDTLFPNGGGVPVCTNGALVQSGIFEGIVYTYDPSVDGINNSTASGYFYYGGAGIPNGWYNTNGFAPGGTTLLNPDTIIQVRNSTSSAVDLVLTGTVPSSEVSLPIVSGVTPRDNIVYNPFPTDVTLATSNLVESGAVAPATDGAAVQQGNFGDVVLVFNPGSTTINSSSNAAYFYYGGAGIPNGWYNTNGFSPSNDVVITAGQAIIIRKAAVNTASNSIWNIDLPYTLN